MPSYTIPALITVEANDIDKAEEVRDNLNKIDYRALAVNPMNLSEGTIKLTLDPAQRTRREDQPLFQVVAVDNYDTESVSDVVIARDIPNEALANSIAQFLNDYNHGHGYFGDSRYCKAYPANRRPYVFEP